MKTLSFWIVAGLIALAVPQGASGAPPEMLSSPQIVEEALRNNGELRALREELGVRQAEEARAGIHPDALLEVGVETGELTGSPGENTYSIGVAREFLTFEKGRLRRAVAGKELEAARARISDAERLLKFEVKERLLALKLIRGQADLARKAVELDQALVRIAEERFAAGDIAEIDVDLAKVEAARARERALAAEREEAPHLAALAQLMGLSPASVPVGREELSVWKIAAAADELTEIALRERPDLRAQVLENEGAAEGVKLARAEGLPNLTAGVTYTHERSITEVGALEEASSDNLLGFRLSVPIPSPGRRNALLQEAGARKGAAQGRLQAKGAAVAAEVRSAWSRLKSAEGSLSLYRGEILPRLERNLKTVQEAYSLGETGILNVIEERRKFQELSNGYLQVLHDGNLALAALEAAVAKDLNALEGEPK